jgi:hypothetical protein
LIPVNAPAEPGRSLFSRLPGRWGRSERWSQPWCCGWWCPVSWPAAVAAMTTGS